MRERTRLADQVGAVQALARDLADAIGYAELADEEGDEASLEEARQQLKAIKDRAARAELEALLSGEADGNDAFLEINSGAGGTESCDWAGMLMRMYTRWAQQHGMEVDYLEETAGDQAGIKSATLQIKGPNAYGWLKTEAGVHRLVRISPFDSNARRHTSFASIWVYPVVDDTIVIDINPADVRTDTYRASGAGGQHINKTDSAVRLTHIPTGIAVACQAGRSQHQNRDEAWKMLRARLYEAELQKREAERAALEDQKTDIGWGHQIRSYVLQPYQMVKDLRTDVETSDTQGVLDGDLDDFMGAALAQRVGAANEAAEA
jgi:peptide chain release factor 2